MAARTPAARALQPHELAALQTARTQFCAWYEGLPQHNHKALAALRDAAKAFREAVQPFLSEHMNVTAHTLLARLQEVERLQHTQGHYSDMLNMADYTAGIIVRATEADVAPGRPRDERAWAWVCMAAAAWQQAGADAPTSTGRFADALRDFKHSDLPPVGGKDQIAAALTHWRAMSSG